MVQKNAPATYAAGCCGQKKEKQMLHVLDHDDDDDNDYDTDVEICLIL